MLIFGKQKIEGGWTKLKKPLAIMVKVEGTEGSVCEYHARGVVRQKLVFKCRPKPIISSSVAMSKRVRLDEPAELQAAATSS